jgi:hypothetical protein
VAAASGTATTGLPTVSIGPISTASPRRMASPMMPPSPDGSGQVTGTGRQAATAAASTMPTSHSSSRRRSRAIGRLAVRRQPSTATGIKSASAPSPTNCMTRSAATAPGVPSRFWAGRLVAWLKLGSLTDHVAKASAIASTEARIDSPASCEANRRRAGISSSVRRSASHRRRISCMHASAKIHPGGAGRASLLGRA